MNFDRIEKFSERLSYALTSLVSLIILVYVKLADYGFVVFAGLFLLLWLFVFFIIYIIRALIMEILYRTMVNQKVNEIQLEVISKPEEECSVCLEPCDKCVELHCGHYFHIKCINTWMEEQMPLATCPNCRAQVV